MVSPQKNSGIFPPIPRFLYPYDWEGYSIPPPYWFFFFTRLVMKAPIRFISQSQSLPTTTLPQCGTLWCLGLLPLGFQVITDISIIYCTVFILPYLSKLPCSSLNTGTAEANLCGYPLPQAPGWGAKIGLYSFTLPHLRRSPIQVLTGLNVA